MQAIERLGKLLNKAKQEAAITAPLRNLAPNNRRGIGQDTPC